MKKGYVISFVLGALIFSSITAVIATGIAASGITYKENSTVEEAIDDLYTKVKPDYTGTTTFTPSSETQTVSTQNKILRDNITINPIPTNYKDLSAETITAADDILLGKKAYLTDGTLVTGTRNECVSGSYTKPVSTYINIPLSFIPSKYYLHWTTSGGSKTTVLYNVGFSNNTILLNNEGTYSAVNDFSINNGGIIDAGSQSMPRYIEQITVYYTACK